ncbi:hypothetical protein C0583_04930 [Candidatus Parcubacteria bacterium]|nr:MAG: hypothetical protein C0583_04930 [Candidatus Parcubacteria bacterium]
MLVKILQKEKGFTLIELLIVIAIIMIVASFAFPVFSNIQNSTLLKDASDQCLQAARQAKNSSCSGKDNNDHGLYFQHSSEAKDKIVIFTGKTYLSRDTNKDIEISFEKTISLSNTFTDNQIIFYQNSCLPDQNGIINISASSLSKNINLSINSIGIISE